MNKPLKVSNVQMVSALFVPGLFELKRTLNKQFYPSIEIETHPMGALCSLKGVKFIIPQAQIQCLVLAEEANDA